MTAEEEPLSAAMVIETTGGVLIQGDPQTPFSGVSTDSRSIRSGELFFALRGEHFDGHRFFVEAVQRGGRGGVVEREIEEFTDESVPIIKVRDTLRSLGDLAHGWRKRLPTPLVAVVGSNGKTTTKEMVAVILGKKHKVMKNPGNFNNLIGLPLSLLKLNTNDQAAVLEMGMNRKGEILRLTQITEPDLGILTNIGFAHVEGVGSIEGVMEAKGELLEGMGPRGKLIFNADDPRVVDLSKRFGGEKISFGIQNSADWMATNILMRPDGGTSFQLRGRTDTIPISLQLIGRHQIYNALAAAAATFSLGAGMEHIKEGLEDIEPSAMRMEVITLQEGIKIINDAYNANPQSMASALHTLAEIRGARKIAVLGDMRELAEYAQQAHTDLGQLVKEKGINLLFLLGQFASHVAHGAREAGMDPQAIVLGKNHHDVSIRLARTVKKGDWVLVKGSRNMNMEEIIKELRGAL
ncbi:MAG: UDP-N-acetylmuramoyl-tripeptide--D-alanyl-D-alanine ligase [Deltaproteobacteria bacterium]|nr:UDP-N-acetylmuramoyl-tripeptide--D-alanyl-D-alanine ligase [Deltaproteobacteria bacterium]